MKKFTFIVLAMLVSAIARAYDYPYLTFQRTDGTQTSVAVANLTLTVADGQLVAQNADTKETFPLAELNRMFFAAEPTGIVELETETQTTQVEVYTLTGMRIGQFETAAQARQQLARGTYLIKHNGKTHKIVKP